MTIEIEGIKKQTKDTIFEIKRRIELAMDPKKYRLQQARTIDGLIRAAQETGDLLKYPKTSNERGENSVPVVDENSAPGDRVTV